MLTIVHLLGPESNSHSHILTVSTQQVNRKMLQVQKTLYASNLQCFVEIQPRISCLHCCGRTTLAPGNPSSVKKHQPRVLTRSRLATPEGGSDTEGDSRCREKFVAPNRWSSLGRVPRPSWDGITLEMAATSDGGPQSVRGRRARFGSELENSLCYDNYICGSNKAGKTVRLGVAGKIVWRSFSLE